MAKTDWITKAIDECGLRAMSNEARHVLEFLADKAWHDQDEFDLAMHRKRYADDKAEVGPAMRAGKDFAPPMCGQWHLYALQLLAWNGYVEAVQQGLHSHYRLRLEAFAKVNEA